MFVVIAIAVAVLLSGLVVIYARHDEGRRGVSPIGNSTVRAWTAIALVIGLLLFTAFSFGLHDTGLRSALIGGVSASVASVLAYYFAAKAAQAQSQAGQQIEIVPPLKGKTRADVEAMLASTSLKLVVDPASTNVTGGATVDKQVPDAGSRAVSGSDVVITLK